MTEPGTSIVRRRILALLAGFSFLSYLLRMNISVAQQYMAPEIGLSDIQIGQVFSAFMLGYALFQLPAGMWGDHRGPRFVLAVCGIGWAVATLLTGLIPGLVVRGTLASLLVLLALRFLLGAGEAATYPVAARAVGNWFPVSDRAFSYAVVIGGATVGSAFTPPLVAALMQALGWRATFYVTSALPLFVSAAWWWQARDRPEQHPEVSPAELAVIARHQPAEARGLGDRSSWLRILKERRVLFLSLSYFFDSYLVFIFVFWLFKYLVDVRKLGTMASGWATSVPFVVASVALPLFGRLSDRLAARIGGVPGRRAVAAGCLLVSAVLLLVGATTESVGVALAAISLSVGFLISTEGPYWSTVIDLAGKNTGAAGGLMNAAGNLGGVVSTAVVPVLVHYLGWFGALASGSACAFASVGFWFMISDRAPGRSEVTVAREASGEVQ
jgi:ACS family glucarate transporter-like MFS transporter